MGQGVSVWDEMVADSAAAGTRIVTNKAAQLEAEGWRVWLHTIFPFAFSADFASFHCEFWDKWWEVCQLIKAGKPVPAHLQSFLLLWGRALAKSSSGTPSSLMKAAFAGRIYSIYLSETIDQAVSHLANVRFLITHPESRLAEYYPHLALEPKVPTSLGLKGKDADTVFITKGGSIFRALGIDSAARGLIIGGKRPDDYNIDDIDDITHGVMVANKHLSKLTRSILLTRDISSDLVVTTKILQNIVIEHGVVNQIHTGKSDAFAERTTIGVINTFKKLNVTSYFNDDGVPRHRIEPDSEPSWDAVSIPKAQAILDLIGLDAFLAECQNEFDRFKAGKVIPEYNEAAQIITWSQFEAMYGARHIPAHWKSFVGLDVGYSEGQYPHYSAWVFIATAAMNTPLPGKSFVYRGRSFTGDSIDDQAEAIKRDMWPHEKPTQWQMSHEKTGEMMTLNQKHGIPFRKFQFYKAEDGVAQWRHVSKCDRTKPNPFNEDELLEDGTYRVGCPQLYYIVDDDQKAAPRDDKGLKLMREQIQAWEYVPVKLTDAGMTQQKPSKVFDDYCDSLKCSLAYFLPLATPKTAQEKFDDKLTDMGLDARAIERAEDERERIALVAARQEQIRGFVAKQKKSGGGLPWRR